MTSVTPSAPTAEPGTGAWPGWIQKDKATRRRRDLCSLHVILLSGESKLSKTGGFVAKSWPGFTAESWEGEEHRSKCYVWSENGIFKVSQATEAQTFGSVD